MAFKGAEVDAIAAAPGGRAWLAAGPYLRAYKGGKWRAAALPRRPDGRPRVCALTAVPGKDRVWVYASVGGDVEGENLIYEFS
ncbi:hypothetical protein [Sphaerisporangium perillae]|uniref:hypothetical protein n=1 Tax=Sphaerisporangium perillae TaxID=2935860 RepID=UPI00200F5483|nr:hypothetical protein [Sphaerisporangium perillae]